MRKKRESARSDVRYLVLWWQAQVPYAAVFDDEVAAYAAANVRNALVVEVSGSHVRFEKVVDYYRRDDAGRPMPAEWRNVTGPIALPWMPKPRGVLA